MDRTKLTSGYKLEGRALRTNSEGDEEGECIFCGELLVGDDGWAIGVRQPDGSALFYHYHTGEGCPPMLAAFDAVGEHPKSPERDRVIFRCTCDGDTLGIIESVGDVCHGCGRDRDNLNY